MTEARVGRLGVAVIALLWIAGALQAMLGGGGGSGEVRSDVPFFEHSGIVTVTFLAAAVAMLIGAFTLEPTRLAWVLATWVAVQLVHFAYHLYDLEIIQPAARLQTMGGLAASLLVAAYFRLPSAAVGPGRVCRGSGRARGPRLAVIGSPPTAGVLAPFVISSISTSHWRLPALALCSPGTVSITLEKEVVE